ncbi:MAG: DEAD/DEAH box helicase family protein [Ktedonobacteraceae bacterium]|nr:DEAD/DEAH box helicase family protein [Ktedonobacteraceae bacterium]
MIELFDFQLQAVAQITDRFMNYMSRRPGKVIGTKLTYIPFYQALASITASGKTVIMAETVAQLLPVLPLKPIIIWLSKGRVVVDQTLTNLAGKYRHLLTGYEDVHLLADYDRNDVEDESLALIYLATVGTFNQRSKDKSSLKLFQSDIDNADQSIWDALKDRKTANGTRRPLLVVYDEAHNLTDQQTTLLLELEPDALLLSSATPKLPQAVLRIIADLKESLNLTDSDITTYVASKDVVEAGLVKRQILLGGYQVQMEETIDDLLAHMVNADQVVSNLGLSLKPKAIYVCRTNIVEGNAYQQDDPKRPFDQREAPPILIWRYLVNEKGIDPASIAVYTSALKFDKDYQPPPEFINFKGGDADYAHFVAASFRHVIFNLGLQEGWDDPEVYFAYIDKSMQSNIQVEQIIGRLLRQPNAHHYEAEVLNTANFYVRVDTKGLFGEIVKEISVRLAGELPEIQISAYDPNQKNRPIPYVPKEAKEVPYVVRDPSAALSPISKLINEDLMDFRGDTTDKVRGIGAKALVQQRVGEDGASNVEWVEREHSNAVSARWIFQTAGRRQFPLALQVIPSDHPTFDAMVEIGSPADTHIRKIANDAVQIYLENVVLKQNLHNPYMIGDVMGDPTTGEKFTSSLHEGYSGLNKTLELPFAHELDRQKVTWCRNPSQSGYGIPLLSLGQNKAFYPDLLAWKGKYIFALDTKGEHLLQSEVGRKLLVVVPHPKAKVSLLIRLISKGTWDKTPQRSSGEGYTVWALGHPNALKPIHCPTLEIAVKTSLRPVL